MFGRLCAREEGLSAAQVAAYFSGPAFSPWQRMGNIEGYAAPLSVGWIGKKHGLQKRVLARMRALGMQPILPAFGGYVPKAFALAHPTARIHRMRPWAGFHETYWLDPADPLFARNRPPVPRTLHPGLWRGPLLPGGLVQRDAAARRR